MLGVPFAVSPCFQTKKGRFPLRAARPEIALTPKKMRVRSQAVADPLCRQLSTPPTPCDRSLVAVDLRRQRRQRRADKVRPTQRDQEPLERLPFFARGPNAPSIGKANAGKVISPVVIHAPREPAERPFGARH
jgi:hypothetical protein